MINTDFLLSRNALLFIMLLVPLIAMKCQSSSFTYDGKKMEGVSLVAPPQPMEQATLQELQSVGVEWVSLMPYAFTRHGDTTLIYNTERQWWGERDEGVITSIQLAQSAGIQVILKPHLWLRGGSFTGDLTFNTEQEWLAWERAYTSYILHFAQLADSMKVPLFCIGTELKAHTKQRPIYWQSLIDTVRSVYKGQLTYADNWDSYSSFPHWDKLDYIGIDAYFPLGQHETPTAEDLSAAWQPHLRVIKQLVEQHRKPVIFTEWGYRSISGGTKEPWRSDFNGNADAQLQAAAYQAFFQTVWPQPWLAGAFLWKWYPQLPQRKHRLETDYTPQGKPAMEVVQEYYEEQ